MKAQKISPLVSESAESQPIQVPPSSESPGMENFSTIKSAQRIEVAAIFWQIAKLLRVAFWSKALRLFNDRLADREFYDLKEERLYRLKRESQLAEIKFSVRKF